MKVGTKSVLYGAHAFWLHPWLVALAWWLLNGFPWDPRLWVAFFVHDLGYWGSPNMDGKEGEAHPFWAARVMARLFDRKEIKRIKATRGRGGLTWFTFSLCKCGYLKEMAPMTRWSLFVLFHSRFLAKQYLKTPSKLCIADKLVIALEPWWLYLPRVRLSGELALYRQTAAERREGAHDDPALSDREWWVGLQSYMRAWVEEHRGGREDTWTPLNTGGGEEDG